MVSEALAAGLHVVVSNRCGVVEFVKDMPGVYVCSPSTKSIREALTKRSKEWLGKIEVPEILAFTPARFVDSLLKFLFSK